MLRYILFLLFCVVLHSQEVSIFDMIGNKGGISHSELSKIAPTDETNLHLSNDQIYEKIEPSTIKMRVKKLPKSVYENQIFSTTIAFWLDSKLNFDFNLTLEKNSDLNWINPTPTWVKNKDGSYETTLWLEPLSTKAALSSATLTLSRNGEFFQKESLKFQALNIKNINKDEKFSNISSSDLKIKKVKSSKFDQNSNIVTIEFEIKNGNLASFTIPKIPIKQEVETIKGDFDNQNGYYFAIIDKDIKELNFNYFNTEKAKFEDLKVEVILGDESLSTHVDLNPKESKFEFYKEIFLYLLTAIFLLIFVLKRSYYFLAISVILIIYTFYNNKPFGDIKIKQGVEIRILPTENSTIFHTTKQDEVVKIIDSNENFTKIIRKDNKIGWIRNEDIK